MTHYTKYSVGLDVSKDIIQAVLIAMNIELNVIIKASHTFRNKVEGFKELLQWVKNHCKQNIPVHFTMEATGVYYESLAWHLHQHQCAVAVVLPNKAKSYIRSIGYKTKNDKIDAKGLAQLGAEQRLRMWEPLSPGIAKLRSLTRQHESLAILRTASINQLHAFEHSHYASREVIQQLKKMIRFYDQQLVLIEKIIGQTVKDDALMNERFTNICRIKGISTLSLATIVAETNGFALMHNKRQLTSYAGYDVIENQSGTHVGRTKISKKGNYRIRRILHMPALVVVRRQGGVFKQLYQRVFERTGIKMKGYVAVQRKLLQLIYHLWKTNQPFQIASSNERAECPLSDGSEGTKKIVQVESPDYAR